MTERDDDTGGEDRRIGRRSVLALTGSAAATALLGVGGASAQATPSKHLLLDTTDTDEPCDYVVEATEALEVVPTDGNSVASTSDTGVEGTVDRGYVAIRYAGWISTIEIDGRAHVSFGDSAKDAFPDSGREIAVTSPTEIDYQFTATEAVERIEDGTRNAAETQNDAITENDDGTVTVDGFTGNGYGDSFVVYGDVTEFTPLEGDHTITVDGEEVTAYELTGQEPEQTKRLRIISDPELDYAFTVTGGAERVQDGTRFEAETNNDTIEQNGDGTYQVSGHTGNGYGDSYDLTGDVTEFTPLEGDYTITVDGQETTAYELTGQEPEQTERLRITADPELDYTFTVTGGAERVQDGTRFDAETNNDAIERNGDGTYQVSGHTGNGYGDSYDLTGDVTSFSPMEGEFTLTLDGEEVTASELTGGEN